MKTTMKKMAILAAAVLCLTGCAAQSGATAVFVNDSFGDGAIAVAIGVLIGYLYARMLKKSRKR